MSDPKTCRVDQCDRVIRCKELCTTHYNNLLAGRPLQAIGIRPLWERFRAHVPALPTDECWPWGGHVSPSGYGRICHQRKSMSAHRLAWEDANGPIPNGLFIDHMCHNRACVNPSHLQLADKRSNGENRAGADLDSSSGVRGVSWDKRTKSWAVYAGHRGKSYNGGRYKTIAAAEAAAIALRNDLHTNNLLDRRVAG